MNRPASSSFRPSWRGPNLLNRAGGMFQRAITLLVWIGAALLAIALLEREPARGFPGTMETREWTVRSSDTGILRQWTITERETVVAGQRLGLLDDSVLLQRLKVVNLDIARLEAESQRTRNQWELEERASTAQRSDDLRAERRRLERDLEDSAWQVLALVASLEEDKIRLQSRSIDVERLEALIAKDLATTEQLTAVRLDRDSLAERVRQGETLRAERQTQVERARVRLGELDRTEPITQSEAALALELAPWQREIEVRRAELDQIAAGRERLSIIAPHDGRILRILVQSGETLVLGQVLAEITQGATNQLIAWIPEAEIGTIEVGQVLAVHCSSQPVQSLAAKVVDRGSQAVVLPSRHWLDPQREEWAIPVHCTTEDVPPFVPGEALSFHRVQVP